LPSSVLALIDYLSEEMEQKDPIKYGFRVSWRRLCLILGTIGFAYVCYKTTMTTIQYTPQERLVSFLASYGIDLQWPPGSSIFDQAFKLYGNAEIV
jgi:hypothetical protein